MNQLIKDQIEKLMKDETKEFMIAYGTVPQEFHGYLSALPQKVRVWGANVPKEEFDELKKTYGNVYQWVMKKDGKDKDSGLFYETNIPFLGVDGCLAMARKDCKKLSIKLEAEIAGDITFVKALVDMDDKHSEGIAILSKESGRSDALEIAASNAIRKALTYLGYGRFATYETPYGENPLIKEFREFVKGKNEKK